MKNPVPTFRAAKKDTTLELFVYGIIGDMGWGDFITASLVQQAMKAAGKFDAIKLHINSRGGDCFEGTTIYNVIRQAGVPVTAIVEGLAASAAFTIAMAGDTILIGEAAMMMLHDAWVYTGGNASELRAAADLLDKLSGTMADLYSKRSGLALDETQKLMTAETWLTADEAIEKGFATEKLELPDSEATQAHAQIAAFNLEKYFAHVPDALKAKTKKASATECACPCDPCKEGNCPDCTDDPCDCEGCTCKNDAEAKALAASETLAVSARIEVLLRDLEIAAQ